MRAAVYAEDLESHRRAEDLRQIHSYLSALPERAALVGAASSIEIYVLPTNGGIQQELASPDLQELICSYGWRCSWALSVVGCESTFNPLAYNPAGPYSGLFQVWLGHRWSREQLEDPVINVAAAWELYQGRGVAHWPECG